MVELREEVGKQMRGDHFARDRRSGNQVGKPRLERVWGRRAERSGSLLPEFGGATGSSESERPTNKSNGDGAPG